MYIIQVQPNQVRNVNFLPLNSLLEGSEKNGFSLTTVPHLLIVISTPRVNLGFSKTTTLPGVYKTKFGNRDGDN